MSFVFNLPGSKLFAINQWECKQNCKHLTRCVTRMILIRVNTRSNWLYHVQLCQICIQSSEWINLTSLAGRIRAFFQNQEIFNCILNWTCKELMWLSSSVFLYTGNLIQTKSNNHGQLKKKGFFGNCWSHGHQFVNALLE